MNHLDTAGHTTGALQMAAKLFEAENLGLITQAKGVSISH